MPEKLLTLRINAVLLKDLEALAKRHEMETERLGEEIIESFLAGERLKKQTSGGQSGFRKPRNQKVH